MATPPKHTIDAPPRTPAPGGILTGAPGFAVADVDGYELYYGKRYTPHLDGHNRDVPVSAGKTAAPVLVKGATGTTGGTFGAGTVYWKITAVDGTGETAGSNEVTATLVAGGTQALSWAAVPGAQLYRIYRGTAANTENVLVGQVSGLAFTDTGAAGTAKAVPATSTAGDAPAADKVFEDALDADLTETVEFRQYRGIDVSLMRHHGEGSALVQAAFEAGEAWSVERAIQEKLFTAAVDLHPGSQNANPRDTLGALEQYIRDHYSGQAYLSGNAMALTYIYDLLVGGPGNWTTKLGTPVVLAGGYGPQNQTDLGRAYLYVHGQINIWRGPIQVVEGPALKENRELALAERMYSVSVDGPVAFQLLGTY